MKFVLIKQNLQGRWTFTLPNGDVHALTDENLNLSLMWKQFFGAKMSKWHQTIQDNNFLTVMLVGTSIEVISFRHLNAFRLFVAINDFTDEYGQCVYRAIRPQTFRGRNIDSHPKYDARV